MVWVNPTCHSERTMKLNLPTSMPKPDPWQPPFTAVGSTSLTIRAVAFGTPWIPSDHYLPHERLGHQSKGRAQGPAVVGVTEHNGDNHSDLAAGLPAGSIYQTAVSEQALTQA